MSLVMAVICTDGIVVSGDFRRTELKINPQTGEERIVGFSDNAHKLVRTKSNRIIGHTEHEKLNNGESVDTAIQNVILLSQTLKMSIYDEFRYLVGCISGGQNSLIEVGIENGKKIALVWECGDKEISVNQQGGAIGDTKAFKKYISTFEEERKNITTQYACDLLKKYNRLVSDETPTISPECEIMVIKPTIPDQ